MQQLIADVPTIEDPGRFFPEPVLIKDPETKWDEEDPFYGAIRLPGSSSWRRIHPLFMHVVDGLRSGKSFNTWTQELPEYREYWKIYGSRRKKLAKKFCWTLSQAGCVDLPLEPPEELYNDRYERLKELGRGGLGVAQLCRDRETGEEVVVKYPWGVKSNIKSGQRVIVAEANALHAMAHHPAYARLIDHFTVRGLQHIVKEFIPGHGLSREAKSGGIADRERRLELFRQCADAVHALHEASYVHRDICPDNFFITPDGTIRISDMGGARVLDPDGTCKGGGGTPGYVATEFRHKDFANGLMASRRSDIFSLGRLYLYLITGKRTKRLAMFDELCAFLDDHGVEGQDRAFIEACCQDDWMARPATVEEAMELLR